MQLNLLGAHDNPPNPPKRIIYPTKVNRAQGEKLGEMVASIPEIPKITWQTLGRNKKWKGEGIRTLFYDHNYSCCNISLPYQMALNTYQLYMASYPYTEKCRGKKSARVQKKKNLL